MTKNVRPVSEKAYRSFTERICLIAKDPTPMLKALDLYLSGDTDTYADALDESSEMAFEMLRFEIDLAIGRSARARERARIRKKPSSESPQPRKSARVTITPATYPDTLTDYPDDDPASHDDIPVMPTRHQRRALERLKRNKSKWRRIG